MLPLKVFHRLPGKNVSLSLPTNFSVARFKDPGITRPDTQSSQLAVSQSASNSIQSIFIIPDGVIFSAASGQQAQQHVQLGATFGNHRTTTKCCEQSRETKIVFFFVVFFKYFSKSDSEDQGSFIWKMVPGLKMFGTVCVQSPSIFYVMAPPLFKRSLWAISGSFFPPLPS